MATVLLYMKIAAIILGISAGINGYPDAGLGCHPRSYTYMAKRTDEFGRKCWDDITTIACWGRCDTAEIAHWKFPYKISFHRVCIHDKVKLKQTTLQFCDPGVDPSLRIYRYLEAKSCSCKVCRSETTSCEPYRTMFPSE
ncbi:glycoprotein hormone beta-5-like [Centruroides vittatus]|uniref:glycoprotein hormone beta-5-like n=1 Tax=Centruroides vittatus TaxID=120091 RepID=UPI00351012EC